MTEQREPEEMPMWLFWILLVVQVVFWVYIVPVYFPSFYYYIQLS
jgi:hypothetical protein